MMFYKCEKQTDNFSSFLNTFQLNTNHNNPSFKVKRTKQKEYCKYKM